METILFADNESNQIDVQSLGHVVVRNIHNLATGKSLPDIFLLNVKKWHSICKIPDKLPAYW